MVKCTTKIKLIRELTFLLTFIKLRIRMQKLVKSMINSVTVIQDIFNT